MGVVMLPGDADGKLFGPPYGGRHVQMLACTTAANTIKVPMMRTRTGHGRTMEPKRMAVAAHKPMHATTKRGSTLGVL